MGQRKLFFKRLLAGAMTGVMLAGAVGTQLPASVAGKPGSRGNICESPGSLPDIERMGNFHVLVGQCDWLLGRQGF